MAETHEKFTPVIDHEYIVTDECMWQKMTPEEQEKYNPYDRARAPHLLQLVDQATGTVVHLKAGSVIKIIKATS